MKKLFIVLLLIFASCKANIIYIGEVKDIVHSANCGLHIHQLVKLTDDVLYECVLDRDLCKRLIKKGDFVFQKDNFAFYREKQE